MSNFHRKFHRLKTRITIPLWRIKYIEKDRLIRNLNSKIIDKWDVYVPAGQFNKLVRELIGIIQKDGCWGKEKRIL